MFIVSDYGEGMALAITSKFEAGETHDVEFDILSELDPDVNTKIVTGQKAGFYGDDDHTIIVALVEDIGSDLRNLFEGYCTILQNGFFSCLNENVTD